MGGGGGEADREIVRVREGEEERVTGKEKEGDRERGERWAKRYR